VYITHKFVEGTGQPIAGNLNNMNNPQIKQSGNAVLSNVGYWPSNKEPSKILQLTDHNFMHNVMLYNGTV